MRGALIVGVDDYPGNALKGCVGDAKRLADVLQRDDFNKRNFDIDLFTSDRDNITQGLLREKILKLFATNSEAALFYFSGHGIKNQFGGFIVTQDGQKTILESL